MRESDLFCALLFVAVLVLFILLVRAWRTNGISIQISLKQLREIYASEEPSDRRLRRALTQGYVVKLLVGGFLGVFALASVKAIAVFCGFLDWVRALCVVLDYVDRRFFPGAPGATPSLCQDLGESCC